MERLLSSCWQFRFATTNMLPHSLYIVLAAITAITKYTSLLGRSGRTGKDNWFALPTTESPLACTWANKLQIITWERGHGPVETVTRCWHLSALLSPPLTWPLTAGVNWPTLLHVSPVVNVCGEEGGGAALLPLATAPADVDDDDGDCCCG